METEKNENNGSPQNGSEQKKQTKETKEERRERGRKKQIRRSVLQYTIAAAVIVVIIYGVILLVQSTAPEGEDHSIDYPIQGREHIRPGATHPPYNSNPPSSGWHYSAAARAGFYAEPLPDERVVHNLEHGDIWIAYHPDIDDAARETLRDFAGQYVIVTPRSANENDIALVAWGRVDAFDIENDSVDTGRITDFIKRYDNEGPEKLRGI